MPRSGPGPATGLPHISSSPSLGVSKPPTMRSSVDLPQPEGPIRQTNSPFSIRSVASDRAAMLSLPKAKRLVTFRTSRIGSIVRAAVVTAERSSMLRAPAQQPPPQHLHQLVGDEAEQADGHHAGDDDLGAGELPRLHNDGAEP